jgi:glycosyltransferase 2 family protein
MNPEKKPQVNKIFLLLILGLVAFIVYFVLFINPASFVDVISQTNLAIYGSAFLAYIIGVFFSSMVWYSLLNTLSVKMSIKKAVLYTWVGLFFDATIPQLGLSGDVAKTYFFSKSQSENAGKVGASVIGQKLMTMTITVVTFSVGLILVLFNYALPASAMASIIVFLALWFVSLFLIYYVSVKPKVTNALLQFCIRVGLFFRKNWNPDGFKHKIQDTLETFHEGVLELKAKPKTLVLPSVFSVLSWMFDIGVMFLVFTALGYSVPVDKVLIVYTISGTLQAVGIGIFGVNEIVMIASFRALGLPDGLSVSVTLLTRAVTLWFRLVMSYGAFQWTSVKLVRQKDNNRSPI